MRKIFKNTCPMFEVTNYLKIVRSAKNIKTILRILYIFIYIFNINGCSTRDDHKFMINNINTENTSPLNTPKSKKNLFEKTHIKIDDLYDFEYIEVHKSPSPTATIYEDGSGKNEVIMKNYGQSFVNFFNYNFKKKHNKETNYNDCSKEDKQKEIMEDKKIFPLKNTDCKMSPEKSSSPCFLILPEDYNNDDSNEDKSVSYSPILNFPEQKVSIINKKQYFSPRPFDKDLFLRLVYRYTSNYICDDLKNKQIVFIMGSSGSGKSSLLNSLMGYKLIFSKKNNKKVLDLEDLNISNSVKINHFRSPSELFSIRTISDLTFIECPGFFNTNFEEHLLNMLWIKFLWKKAKAVKGVLININFESIDFQRGEEFIRLVKFIKYAFKCDIKKHKNIMWLINKIPCNITNEQISLSIGKIKNRINAFINPESYKYLCKNNYKYPESNEQKIRSLLEKDTKTLLKFINSIQICNIHQNISSLRNHILSEFSKCHPLSKNTINVVDPYGSDLEVYLREVIDDSEIIGCINKCSKNIAKELKKFNVLQKFKRKKSDQFLSKNIPNQNSNEKVLESGDDLEDQFKCVRNKCKQILNDSFTNKNIKEEAAIFISFIEKAYPILWKKRDPYISFYRKLNLL